MGKAETNFPLLTDSYSFPNGCMPTKVLYRVEHTFEGAAISQMVKYVIERP